VRRELSVAMATETLSISDVHETVLTCLPPYNEGGRPAAMSWASPLVSQDSE
jgi:hypothetical protein